MFSFSGPYHVLSIYTTVFYQLIFLGAKEVKIFLSTREQKMKLQLLYPVPLICVSIWLVPSVPVTKKRSGSVSMKESHQGS
jgi:hypothetical protein